MNLNVPVTFDAVRDRAALAAAAAPPASADPAAAPVAPPEISDDDLEALGQARAAAVQQALLSGGALDPGRVLIVRQPTVSGKDGPVEMKLAVTR